MEKRVVIVIPARYGATRLPGKPLVEILGKPMVQHVYERAMQVPNMQAVVVATDDDRIMEVVRSFGGHCLMTSNRHPSGTDRLTEVMEQLDAEIYINLQCDEPLVRPEDIAKLAKGMWDNPSVPIATLCHRISHEDAKNPHLVKVVITDEGDALYFSRSPIPYDRTGEAYYFKHVGIYAYRRQVLSMYGKLPRPMIEQAEKLEQLRLLAAGFRIRVFEVNPVGPGVDTPQCLAKVRSLMQDS